MQVLNYDRIRAKRIRYLPLNLRPDEESGDVVYLRLVDLKPDGTVIFSACDPSPQAISGSAGRGDARRSVTLHGWTWIELWDIFSSAGFEHFDLSGGFDSSAFKATESMDLVAVVQR